VISVRDYRRCAGEGRSPLAGVADFDPKRPISARSRCDAAFKELIFAVGEQQSSSAGDRLQKRPSHRLTVL